MPEDKDFDKALETIFELEKNLSEGDPIRTALYRARIEVNNCKYSLRRRK